MISLALTFVSLRKVIMHQWIVWIEFQDAFLFGDGFIKAAQVKIAGLLG